MIGRGIRRGLGRVEGWGDAGAEKAVFGGEEGAWTWGIGRRRRRWW